MPSPQDYRPTQPLSVTWSCSLSQDVVASASILVDTALSSPVGVFVNPYSKDANGNPQAEALAAVPMEGGTQICHLSRDASTTTGWKLKPLFDGLTVTSVAVATLKKDSSTTVYGFFTSTGTCWSTVLGADGTWMPPRVVAPAQVEDLQVSYYSDGSSFVLYGRTSDGNLFLAYPPNGDEAILPLIYDIDQGLSFGNFKLGLITPVLFELVFIKDDVVTTCSAILKSVLEAQQAGFFFAMVGSPIACEKQASTLAYAKTPRGIASAISSPLFSGMTCIIVNTDSVVTWSSQAGMGDSITDFGIQSASYTFDTGGACHLYFVDDDMNLWATHQFRDSRGLPCWTTAVPIDSGIQSVVNDMNPVDVPTLFAIDGATGALRLHTQPSPSGAWLTGEVLQPSKEVYEISRFRTEIFVSDANGAAVPNCPVTLTMPAGGSPCEIWACGTVSAVGTHTKATFATGPTGHLTFATLVTNGISTPDLVATVEGSPEVTIQPGWSVHNYLAGNGTLNPTNPADPSGTTGTSRPFDPQGTQLAAAKLWPSGETLAPGAADTKLAGVAAQAIQSTAQVGMKTFPPEVAGYTAVLDKDSGPSFQTHTPDELNEVKDQFAFHCKSVGSFIHGAEACVGDIWTGIKHGTVQIIHAVVDVANSVAQLVVKIGNEIKSGVSLALDGLEQAGHFITGVFAVVEAGIEKVVDWLKALFDFSAILNTMNAYQQVLAAIPNNISSAVESLEQRTGGWFAKQEQTVSDAIAGWKKHFEGQRFMDLQDWQEQGHPPSKQPLSKPADGASPADCISNVHHNWFWEKMHSYMKADSGTPASETTKNLEDAIDQFVSKLGAGGDDFKKGLEGLYKTIKDIIDAPTTLQEKSITDFLDALSDLIKSGLKFCDATVDAINVLTQAVLAMLEAALTARLDIPEIDALWSWLAKKAGASPTPLTMGSLLSLVLAFPSTIVYKLVKGVQAQPFPNGALDGLAFPPSADVRAQALSSSALSSTMLRTGSPSPASVGEQFVTPVHDGSFTTYPACLLASAILQVIYVSPAGANDALAADSPWWLSVTTIVGTAIIVGLRFGWPDWDQNQWDSFAIAALVAALLYLFFLSAATGSEQRTDIMSQLLCGVGLVEYVITACVIATKDEPDRLKLAASLLLPLAPVFQFVKVSEFRDTPQSKLACMAVSAAVDMVSYVGGGTLKVIDAASLA